MKFENVSILTDCIKDIIRDMRYCWVDSKGSICDQKGVFRINCVDCLDRTNVVQTAIARIVMETQCRKLGLLPPDETLPQSCRVAFQLIWANNGDAISHQYAGTAALKGDYTRTGERKLSGLMKDGVNSANRYYLRFKDDYRQAAIDVLLGQPIAEETLLSAGLQEEDIEGELLEKEENVRTLIDDLKKMLIVEPEQCLGGWSLVNADPVVGDHDRQEMDIILLLSQRAFYVGWYDDEKEAVTQYQQVLLEDIVKIEIGLEPLLFKSKHVCMRIHYNGLTEEGFFHTFRVPSTRLFNNVVVSVKNEDDAKESLKAVCHCFLASKNIVPNNFEVVEKQKLERMKLKPHPEVIDIGKQLQETSLAAINLPRNVSESSLNETEEETEKQLPNQQQNHGFFLSPKLSFNTESNIHKGDFSNKLGLPLRGTSLQLPKLNLHNLNPIKNVNLKALRLPTVFYSNKETKSSMERLTISTKHSGDEVSDSGNSLKHLPPEGAGNLPQSSDTDVVSNKNLLDMTQDENTDVMFRSCGILATNPKQLFVTSLSLSSDVDPEELPQEISTAIDETRKSEAADQLNNLLSLDLVSSESEIENSRMALNNKTEQENFMSNIPDTYASSYPASIHDDYDDSSNNYDHFNYGDASTELAEHSRDMSNQRRRPLPLKPSFSDGAISSHPDINTYPDLQKPLLLLENNPFTKIGQKIQSSMSRSSSKATVDLLKEQVLEKLKDRECETQIIFI
ncbi:phosphatidylinositide phosphatase SAC2 [Octopus bimaculoides]|nr:phosphatidylinositide phosphatase SAC2 [Octopus bimaculoides]